MIYHTTYRPRAASQIPQGSPLSQFVEFLWFREGDHLPQSQSRLLPIGSMELVINPHEDRIPLFDRQSRAECGSTNGTMICGTHSEGYIIRIDSKKWGNCHLCKLPLQQSRSMLRMSAHPLHSSSNTLASRKRWQPRALYRFLGLTPDSI